MNSPFHFFIVNENGEIVQVFSEGGPECVGVDDRSYIIENSDTALLVDSFGFVRGEFDIHKTFEDVMAASNA